MSKPIRPVDEFAARRKRAARTALVAGAIALIIYIGFILSGIVAT